MTEISAQLLRYHYLVDEYLSKVELASMPVVTPSCTRMVYSTVWIGVRVIFHVLEEGIVRPYHVQNKQW